MVVREFMRTTLVQVQPGDCLWDAAQALLQHGVDTALVMDGERLLGVIGLRDLFTAPIPARHGGRMSARRSEVELTEIWRRQTIGNILTDEVLSVTEDTPLMTAAALMVNSGKHPLPVLRDGRVVGTIDRADVVRALLTGQPAEAGR